MAWFVLVFVFSPRPFAGPFIFFCSFNVPQHLPLSPAFNVVCQVSIRFNPKTHESAKLSPFLFLAIQLIYLSGSLEQSCILLHQHSREVISYSVSYSFWTHREAANVRRSNLLRDTTYRVRHSCPSTVPVAFCVYKSRSVLIIWIQIPPTLSHNSNSKGSSLSLAYSNSYKNLYILLFPSTSKKKEDN